MVSQVAAQCFVEHKTGFLVDEMEINCRLNPCGNSGGKHRPFCWRQHGEIYYGDDRYSNFIEKQVKELKAEKNQSF